MSTYYFLLCKEQQGELTTLFAIGLPTHLKTWMQIYAYHLAHPRLSHFELSLDLNISKSTIQRALSFMNQSLN